jgi:hypothetical protein
MRTLGAVDPSRYEQQARSALGNYTDHGIEARALDRLLGGPANRDADHTAWTGAMFRYMQGDVTNCQPGEGARMVAARLRARTDFESAADSLFAGARRFDGTGKPVERSFIESAVSSASEAYRDLLRAKELELAAAHAHL